MGTTAWWSGRRNRGGWRLTGHLGLPPQPAVDGLFRSADRPLVLAYVADDDLAGAAGTDDRGRVAWTAALGRPARENDVPALPSAPTDAQTIAAWAGEYTVALAPAEVQHVLETEWTLASEGLHELFSVLALPLPETEETLRQTEWEAGPQRETVFGARLASWSARSLFVEASPWRNNLYRFDRSGQVVGRAYSPAGFPASLEPLGSDWIEVPATVPRTIAATLQWVSEKLAAEAHNDRGDG